MHKRNHILRLSLLAVTVGFASAQAPRLTPLRIPAPLWPGEAAATTNTEQGVYYDLANAQAVILTRGAGGNVVGEVRRDIPNLATPAVSFSVQRSQGSLLYSYVLTDPPSAKQRTKSVSVLLPDHDSGLATTGWPTQFAATTLPDRSATVSMATMRSLTWEDQSLSSASIQNLQLALRSNYLPGLGDAEVQGLVNNPITPADFSGLSPDVAKQLSAFLEAGMGSTRYTVLLPLFRQDTSKLVIASNYSYAVSLLSRRQLLNSGSAYVTQLAASLQQFLGQGGTSAFQAVDAVPATPLEQAIQSAVAIALQ